MHYRMLLWRWHSYCCGGVHSDWVSSSSSSHHCCDDTLLEKKSKVCVTVYTIYYRFVIEWKYDIIESHHNTRILVMPSLHKVEKFILAMVKMCMKIQTEPPPPHESSSWLSVLPMWPLLPALHSQPLKPLSSRVDIMSCEWHVLTVTIQWIFTYQ